MATHPPKKGNLSRAPLSLCLDHSVHLVSLLRPPQSSYAGPQDVEGRTAAATAAAAAAAAAARCLSASASSPSNPFFQLLKARPERERQRETEPGEK